VKRLLIILFSVFLANQLFGQGLLSVGDQNPGKVIVSAAEGSTLYTICVDKENAYSLWEWNNHFFVNHGIISDFPAHGTNADGEFAVKDAIIYNSELYVLGDYYINTSGTQSDLVYKWDGSNWIDVSNSIVKKSTGLTKFIIYNGELLLVGVFENEKSNLLSWKGNNQWESMGDLLTLNMQKDYIIDAFVHNGTIYASGSFSEKVGPYPYRTAVFNGQKWSSIKHPPFLYNSYVFGKHDDELVLTGSPNNKSDYLKSFNGAGWDNISDGLENFDLKTFTDVISYSEKLYVAGDFVDIQSGVKFNLLVMDRSGWKAIKWEYQSKSFHFEMNNDGLFVVGEFDLYGIKNIAQVSTGDGIIAGRIFEDLDANCLFTNGDKPISNQVIVMNPGSHVFWSDADGYFRIPAQKGTYAITLPDLIKYKANCSSKLKVNISDPGNYATDGFALTVKPDIVDIKVKAGFSNGYKLIIGRDNRGTFEILNNGTVSINAAEFSIKMDDIWNSIAFDPTFDRIEEGRFIWEISNLDVNETFKILMSGNLREDLNGLKLSMEYDATVLSPESDMNPIDNSRRIDFSETNSLEPIFKQCGNGLYFYEEDPLNYYIGFSNVGNGMVDKLVVRDTIDEDVYIGMKGVQYYTSHDQVFSGKLIENEGQYSYVLTWVFDNINLPDSTSKTKNNVGYVQMNINLAKGYHPSGTMVCNKAEVFMDQQEPYTTNVVCSEARNVSSRPLGLISGIEIFPNPALNEFSVQNLTGEDYTIMIYNTSGQLVKEEALRAYDKQEVSAHNWSKGVYYIKINGFDCQKLIVQ
jgi:Secretion system C-terminal sorting domain